MTRPNQWPKMMSSKFHRWKYKLHIWSPISVGWKWNRRKGRASTKYFLWRNTFLWSWKVNLKKIRLKNWLWWFPILKCQGLSRGECVSKIRSGLCFETKAASPTSRCSWTSPTIQNDLLSCYKNKKSKLSYIFINFYTDIHSFLVRSIFHTSRF